MWFFHIYKPQNTKEGEHKNPQLPQNPTQNFCIDITPKAAVRAAFSMRKHK